MSTINYALAKRLAELKGHKANPAALYGRKLGQTHLATPSRMDGHFKIGSTICQWQDKPAFNFVGNADEICPSIGHHGWHMQEDSDGETDPGGGACWGVVYKLPHDKYLAGVADSNQASRKNGAHDPCILGVGSDCIYETKEAAAYAADGLARISAEEAREYSARDCAERDAERLREENVETLSEVSGLIREMKEHKASNAPAICTVLRSKIKRARSDMSRNRRTVRDLKARYSLA